MSNKALEMLLNASLPLVAAPDLVGYIMCVCLFNCTVVSFLWCVPLLEVINTDRCRPISKHANCDRRSGARKQEQPTDRLLLHEPDLSGRYILNSAPFAVACLFTHKDAKLRAEPRSVKSRRRIG